jgi:hypothetical protein
MAYLKAVSLTLLAAVFVSAQVLAEGKKLAEKLPNVVLTSEVKGCEADVQKYCPGLDPNSQKAFMCLMAYEEKISDDCKLGILEAAMAIKMGAAALDYSISECEADADKHCLDVEPGEGRMVNCLKNHESDVSKECVTALKETGLWNYKAK